MRSNQTNAPAMHAWLENIFDEMGAAILGYVRTVLHDRHGAEDVVQNVFVKLLTGNVRHDEIRNVRAFVFTIAHHEAMRELGKKRHTPRAICDEEAIFTIADRQTLSPGEAISLEEALHKLPVEQREVVYMKIYANMTFDEIAQILAISANTAASRYRYALEKMRDLLGEEK